MKTERLFGFNSGDIQSVRRHLFEALAMDLAPHESAYRGGLYYRGKSPAGGEYILQSNVDFLDGELIESTIPEAQFLLYLSETADHIIPSEQLLKLGWRLLKTEPCPEQG